MLFPVEFRALRPERMPWLSWSLVALWLLAGVLAALGLPAAPEAGLGVLPAAVTPLDFATHWLWHESWAHGLATVLTLLALGPLLEEAWGRIVLGGFLFVGLLATAAIQVWLPGDPMRPIVGASGLAAALVTAVMVRFWSAGLHWTAVGWWQGIVHTRVGMPSIALLGAWFGFEVLMQLAGDAVGSTRGLQYSGVLLGAVLGGGSAFAWSHYGLEERFAPERADDPPVAIELARLVREEEGPVAALQGLEPAIRVHPDDDTLVAAFCQIGLEADAFDRVRSVFEARLRSALEQREPAAAARLWERFAGPLGRPTQPPKHQIALAQALKQAAHPDEAARALRAVLETPKLTMGLALRVTELARDLHAGVALQAARHAQQAGNLPEPKRARLAKLIEELEARHATLEEPDLDLDPDVTTAEVADPNDRSLELGLPEDDLRKPPPKLSSPAAEAPAPPAFDFGEGADPTAAPTPSAPLALSLDGSLDESADEPLADGRCIEPTNSTNADAEIPTPETLPMLQPLGASNASPGPAAQAPGMPPLQSLNPPAPTAPVEAPTAPPSLAPLSASGADSASSAVESLDPALEVAAAIPRFSDAKRVEAVPVSCEQGKLRFRHGQEALATLKLDRVQALAAGAVAGLAPRPVLVIDLLLNWQDVSDDHGTLRVVRLRSDRFEPSVFDPAAELGLEGFRQVIAQLLESTGASPLPSADAVRGRPFAMFADLAAYEREVLQLAL